MRYFRLLVCPLASIFFLALNVGCNGGSSSSDSNPAQGNVDPSTGNPFQEILEYGVGTYTGDCVSLSTGMPVGASITLSSSGALNGSEFTSTFARSTHVLAFSQKRNNAKSSIVSAEWDGARQAGTGPIDDLLLRFDSTAGDPRVNEVQARLEDTFDNKGVSCAIANTSKLISSDMFLTFRKYLNKPKFKFTACYCFENGSSVPVYGPASDLNSSQTSVSVRGSSVDLSKHFLEQMVSVSPSDQSFGYTLVPTDDELVIYEFDRDLRLRKFSAQFASGKNCVCQ